MSKLRLEGSAAITQVKRRNKIVLSGGEGLSELRGEGGGGVTAEVLSVVTQWWGLGRRIDRSGTGEVTASDHPALLDREEVDVDPILRIIFPKSILTLSPTLTHSGISLQ